MKQISSGRARHFLGGDLSGIALKLDHVGPIFSSFNLCPPLQSTATDDCKHFQSLT